MSGLRRAVLIGIWLGSACTASSAGQGEPCTRSAQCEPGLACIQPAGARASEGRCGSDLSSLYDPDQIPRWTAPDAGDDDAGRAADH